jgi:hypothetical protein
MCGSDISDYSMIVSVQKVVCILVQMTNGPINRPIILH